MTGIGYGINILKPNNTSRKEVGQRNVFYNGKYPIQMGKGKKV